MLDTKLTRVLGIDPGIASVGWGIIEVGGDSFSYVNSGVIAAAAKYVQPTRLKIISDDICGVASVHDVDMAAMESLSWAGKNKGDIAEAMGVIRLGLWNRGLYVWDYSPTAVKKVVAGSGKAIKAEVSAAVADMLSIDIVQDWATHEWDALAVALTHWHRGEI